MCNYKELYFAKLQKHKQMQHFTL